MQYYLTWRQRVSSLPMLKMGCVLNSQRWSYDHDGLEDGTRKTTVSCTSVVLDAVPSISKTNEDGQALVPPKALHRLC